MGLQMTWHARCRRGGASPLGLKNLGNSCYLNSVLQCLTYTPPLAQFCLSSRHSSLCKSVFANREKECPFCILERQIVRSLTLDGANITESPSKILKCLSLFAEHFRWGRQEDAHEFLRYVIDACHNACLKLHKLNGCGGASGGVTNGDSKVEGRSRPTTVMNEIFGGALLSQVKCLTCNGDSNKVDEILDICLDVFHNSSLKDALARFFQPEELDGNNKYSCSNCKKLSVAKKQMFIHRAPNVLVIQLKRFEGIHGGKINRNIDFDELLGLSKFMSNPSQLQDLEPEYSLFGCIVHSGFSPESGHYYAYIKDASGRWFCCNDAHVSLSSSQEVLSEKVYMLFYIRTNGCPKPTKSALSCNGFKPSVVNGSSVQSQKTVQVLKPTIANSNGASSTNNGSALLKNGKPFSSPQIKPINLKNLEIKRTFPNGNGNLDIQKKGASGEGITTLASCSPSENKTVQKFETSTTSNLNAASVDISFDGQQNKHTSLLPNGNGCSQPSKRHSNSEDTEYVAATRKDSGNASSAKVKIDNHQKVNPEVHSTKSSENSDSSTNDAAPLPRENGSYKNEISCGKKHSREIEKFKELLSREASSELHSCGWVDKVQDFMRAKKRLCLQAADVSYDKSSTRKQLISDARKTFISQIPESLKEHLVERLRSFSQESPLSDP
ncbi:ubiquitin carboxyl-terminal hydrolase 25-like isoform X1 [Zingiber officinale]|uniref:ubiquitin carboxyl-terminal hydrolase 25-like isoform X1 n=1 Tax=Zingiber officinale TaxID=94328 RepID=UPI001C4B931F|nr:ubiquitin carboxyl-terminal hydrolase 25-like isoform X1 [Zingiber officinale]